MIVFLTEAPIALTEPAEITKAAGLLDERACGAAGRRPAYRLGPIHTHEQLEIGWLLVCADLSQSNRAKRGPRRPCRVAPQSLCNSAISVVKDRRQFSQ